MNGHAVLILTVLMSLMYPGEVFSVHQGPPKAKCRSIEGDREKRHEMLITAAFWDREYLDFSFVKAPQWLKLDSQSGEISGTPGIRDVGEHEVMVQVMNNQGGVVKRSFFIRVIDR